MPSQLLSRRGLSLRARVALVLLALLIGLLIAGRALTVAMSDLLASRSFVYETALPIDSRVGLLQESLLNEETGLRGYLLGRRDDFLEPYTRGGADTDRLVAEIKDLVARSNTTGWVSVGGRPTEVLSGLQGVVDANEAWRARTAEPQRAAVARGASVSATEAVAGEARFDTLRGKAAALKGLTGALLDRSVAATDGAISRLRRILAVSFALMVVMVLFGTVALLFFVDRPVRRLSASMAAVAGGDLITPLDVSGASEIAVMGSNAERMRIRLLAELEELRMANEALEQEGPTVTRLRELLAPTLIDVAGFEIRGSVVPAQGALAGDWWDVVPLPDGTHALAVVDVAGHGAEAGVNALRIRDTFRLLLQAGQGPVEVVAATSRLLGGEAIATALVIVLDEEQGVIRWVNAGHPSPLLRHPDDTIEELASSGPLLSVLQGTWHAASSEFSPGAVLACVTDGVLEAHARGSDPLGEEGFATFVASIPHGGSLDDDVAALLSDVSRATAGAPSDDVTVVLVCRDQLPEQ